MDSQSLNRALMSSGLWLGVTWAVAYAAGVDAPWAEIGTDSAIMGLSAFGSDLAHSSLGMVPSAFSSAIGAGTLYTGIQRAYRGDDSYMTNFGLAFANDYLVEFAGSAAK